MPGRRCDSAGRERASASRVMNSAAKCDAFDRPVFPSATRSVRIARSRQVARKSDDTIREEFTDRLTPASNGTATNASTRFSRNRRHGSTFDALFTSESKRSLSAPAFHRGATSAFDECLAAFTIAMGARREPERTGHAHRAATGLFKHGTIKPAPHLARHEFGMCLR